MSEPATERVEYSASSSEVDIKQDEPRRLGKVALMTDQTRPNRLIVLSQGEPIDKITPKERETLELVSIDLSNKQVAQQLSVKEKTVGYYLSNIYRKLDVTTRAEAAEIYHASFGETPQTGGDGRALATQQGITEPLASVRLTELTEVPTVTESIQPSGRRARARTGQFRVTKLA